ncbi:hypothetical protein ACFLVZ_02420 [Chloroflexota bacterium]
MFLKIILIGIPVALLFTSIFLLSSGNNSEGLPVLFETIFVGAIFWVVFPRSYQVFEDHLCIVLGGPFSVNVSFGKIEKIQITNRFSLTINFATRLTGTCVEITRKSGLSIAITPRNSDLFIEKANQVFNQWTEKEKG